MPEEPELTPIPAKPATQPGMESTSGLPTAQYQSANLLQEHKHSPQRIPRWLERSELFLRVLLRLYIGLFLFYAPWSHFAPILPWAQPFWDACWDKNPLFTQFPALGAYATTGAVRGIISGLGLLNLWIAFREAIRHRDG